MRYLLLLFAAPALFADAHYKLAYTVKANSLIQMVAGLAGISRMSSEGDEVFLKGSRLLVKGEKSTILLNYASGQMMLVDHTDKTFERLRIEDMRQRMQGDIPTPLIEGLKRMFPGGGSGVVVGVKPERVENPVGRPSLESFRKKFGLGYLLPAMESLASLMPAVEKELATVKNGGELVDALRVQIGTGGKVIDGLVEIRDYREAPVDDAIFNPPAGYTEVK